MGIMQTRTIRLTWMFTATLFIFSALVSAFPHVALAAPALNGPHHTMDGQSMMDMAVCTFDCGQVQNCFEHCITDSEDDHQVVAVVPSQVDLSVDAVEQVAFSHNIPPKQLFFINTSDRAPPALTHIRSVRKLE